MVGHRWLPWIDDPTRGATSVTSTKQEQEMPSGCLPARRTTSCHHACSVVGLSALCLLLLATCAALSVLYTNETDGEPGWRSLLRYRNMSDGLLALARANADLRKDNELLREHSVRLEEQTRLLNGTTAELESATLALSSESGELAERVANLTAANAQLRRERERLVRHASELEEVMLNASRALEHLVSSGTRLSEEKRRLSEANGLLRDELLRARGENRELAKINDGFRGEIRNLSEEVGALSRDEREKLQEEVMQLREQNLSLSAALALERQDAAQRERGGTQRMQQMQVDLQSATEAFHSLNLYCPVVNQRTEERICKKCQDSWRLFETRCYYFSSRLLTWTSSRAWCRARGGDLLVINSEREQSFIFDTSRALEPSGARLWVGMTDAEEEGDWRWVDGSRVTSDAQYWLSRPGTGTEPDDWKLDDPAGEDCGHIDTSENALKSWMDGSCEIPYRWICEKNV